MSQRALIILHPGFEEMEATAPIDLLARAGVEVIQAATSSDQLVKGRNGMSFQATHRLSDVASEDFDAVILPGGPGIMNLRNDATLCATLCACLKRQHAKQKLIACICAAPLLLLDSGLCDTLAYTAHPSTLEELSAAHDQAVVIDKHIITSRGAGTATEFALAIVETLCGQSIATEIAESICWSH